MVFRKPYAFLIKNFKKIHILMLFFWVYIYYKLFIVKDFVKEFISLGTYNSSLENISNEVNIFFYISVFLMFVISISLLILLRYKKKPWKLYLIVAVEYIFILYSTLSLVSFFKSYDPITPVSSIYFNRDIFNISSWIQYAVLIVLIIRITGLDLKKFGFSNDKEFLELNSSDREEFEINIEFDKHSITRKYNQIKRNLNYFYQEHKFIIRLVILILIISIASYSYYLLAIVNKSYKQNQTFNIGRYDITIEGAYVTDKNDLGEVIEEKSKFILLKVKMKNIYDDRVEVDFSRLHLMNSSNDITNTVYYDSNFKDLGNLVSQDNLLYGNQEKEFNLVYKVPKDMDIKRFVLYCQEYKDYNSTYLRKVKLNVLDVAQISQSKEYKIGDVIKFEVLNGNEDIIFESASFENSVSFNRYQCINGENCKMVVKQLVAAPGKKILKIVIGSSSYEGKQFVDFSCKYGKIRYVDSSGKTGVYNITDLINTDYEGKEIFIDITDQIVASKEIYIDYAIRNKKYSVKIK